MRQFEVAPGGYTPKHSHHYEHEVFVLEGAGVVLEGDVEHPLKAGDVVFVTPGEPHQFKNTGAQPLKFLCMVPNSSVGQPVTRGLRMRPAERLKPGHDRRSLKAENECRSVASGPRAAPLAFAAALFNDA